VAAEGHEVGIPGRDDGFGLSNRTQVRPPFRGQE
jgi:hypothetical protein